MQRLLIALGLVCLTLVGFTGCGPSEEEIAAQENETHRQRLEELQAQHDALQAKRAEAEELRAQLEAAPEVGENNGEGNGEEAADGAGQGGDETAMEEGAEDPAARLEQLQEEVRTASEELYMAVGSFLNDDVPLLQGEEPTEVQKAALRIKSAEDMVLAREYIVEGGDYKRAIAIYQAALDVDPDNTALQEALVDAEANRFMTEERLSQVKKGMSPDEVREVLGRPIHYNIRDYEQGGQTVTAWYYPKNEGGAAAAVWFRPRRGEVQVYRIDFNAVEGKQDEESEG